MAREDANPFEFGMGLSDPKRFVGRRKELGRALDLLRKPGRASVAILGPTRIGKTSLLERIMAALAEEPAPVPLCAVALAPLHLRERATMFQPVVEALAEALPNHPAPQVRDVAPEGFLRWLHQAVGNTRVVLFLDDFDDWAIDEELRFEMYNILRSAVWRQSFALCLTTRCPLQELCSVGGESRSLLWNIFTTIEPGLLGLHELRDLIFAPHTEAGLVVTEEEWELVLAEAGPHPCLAQIAGYHLFAAKRETPGPLTQEQLYHLGRTIRREVRTFFPAFADYLKTRDGPMVDAAKTLAARGQVSEDEADRLVQLAVAYRTARGVRLMSDAFGEFLAREGDQRPAKEPARSASGARGGLQPAAVGAGVFLCHSSKDRAFAERLCHDLFHAGIDVWVDWLDIDPGETFERAIETALAAATHVVLVVSPDAIASDWVRSEVEWALHEDKTLIPVRCAETQAPLPPRWHARESCDATTEIGYARSLLKLVRLLPRRAGERP